MKVKIINKDNNVSEELIKKIKEYNFILEDINPELIISHGGDGTLLISEREFPGIKKIAVRNSKICKNCHDYKIDDILQAIKNNNYKIEEHIKLETINTKSMNDIIIRNKNQQQAIRFKIKINKKEYKSEFIGDGIVISTPFGSRGYFNSITRKNFKKGIGIAFNNTTSYEDIIIIPENSEIEFHLTRGEAVLTSDNDSRNIILNENSKIIIKKSDETAKLIKI